MALESLKGVTEIGGFKVQTAESAMEYGVDETSFISIYHAGNSIAFKLQSGPIKEVGVNGCQVDTMIEAAILIIQGFNAKFPCEENAEAIQQLRHAIYWLSERRIDREKRGVEGFNKE